jgi:hypothetical protein
LHSMVGLQQRTFKVPAHGIAKPHLTCVVASRAQVKVCRLDEESRLHLVTRLPRVRVVVVREEAWGRMAALSSWVSRRRGRRKDKEEDKKNKDKEDKDKVVVVVERRRRSREGEQVTSL